MSALDDIRHERAAQDIAWGEQNHPDGTSELWATAADVAHFKAERAHQEDTLRWFDILREQYWQVACEEDPKSLRVELIRLAAVAVAWTEAIDRRNTTDGPS